MKVRAFLLEGFSKLQLLVCEGQRNPPPLIYFCILAYSHFAAEATSLPNTYLLSLLPLLLALTLRYNFMFMTAAFVRVPSFYLAALLCLLTLALACNDKHKTYVFLFTLGDALAHSPSFKSAYLALAGALFCLEIYNHWVFGSLSDNRKYFTGFFAVAVLGVIEFADGSIGIGINWYLKGVLVAVGGMYGNRLMGQRMIELQGTDIKRIKDSRLMAFYLQEIGEEVRTGYVQQSKVVSHKRDCRNPHCFCVSGQNLTRDGYYLRQLYENSVTVFSHTCDPLLFQHYVLFLLRNEMVLKALYFLKKWSHSSSYYHWIAKLRCLARVKRMLFDLSSSSLYERQFAYALEYDSLLLQLTMQIYEVLELKLGFWHQAARETPLMVKLQEQGLRIVDSMYELNVFYSSTIKKYEKKLYSFDATILYAMYLLSTTNFKDYAELIIKNTSKMLEEVQIQENNSSETYAIRTVIKREGLYYIKDASEELKCLSLEGRKEGVTVFKLIIDNASNSFCKMVKIPKEELLGEELNQLVPDGYRAVHRQQLARILNFQAEEIGEVVSSKQLHKAVRLPMKVGRNELVMACISIKMMVDIEEGTSFISVVKKANDRVLTALVGLEGEHFEREEGFNEEVLDHSEFKKYLAIVGDRWRRDGVIKEERFNVMISAMNFCIAINSPLAWNFAPPLLPPLHVEILNESTTRNRGQQTTAHSKLVKEIRNMENAINHDSESSSSSKNSNSAINILSTFSQKNSVPLYRRVILGFLFVITCCLVASVVSYEFSNLDWDPTSKVGNPINDTMNYMKLQHLTANILLNLWDTQEYLANSKLNKTEITVYFNQNSSKPTYIKSIDTIFRLKFVQFEGYFYSCLRFPSQVLDDQFNFLFSTSLPIANLSVVPSSTASQLQNITFQSLLMNYLSDFNIMARGIYNTSLLLPITYSATVINLQNATSLSSIIDSSVRSSIRVHLSLAIAMGVLIALLVIPMSYFLRSRLPMHEKIFDLFASIDSEMVIREIKSLGYISNIIKNYGESSEVLKNNVLEYKENAIYPKRGGSRKSSVNNEIVLGLERFDMTSEVEEEAGMLSGREGNFKKLGKRRSHISNMGDVQEYVGMKRALERRKRAGDLDFTGSESDPKKRVNPRHLVIYLMTLFFIIFLVLETSSTRTYTDTLLQQKNNLMKVINDYTSVQLNFLLSKLYLRYGSAALPASSGYGISYLQTAVQSIPTYDYTNFYGYDTIYPNCTITKRNITISQTVCMYNYSYLTLMGEFGAIIKQLFETRYSADLNYATYLANNQTDIYTQIVTNISAKVFYMQTIDNKLETLVYNIADYVYLQILNNSVSIYNYKLAVLVASVSWWAVTFLVGLGMILAMKRRYFKEVYMLTFLNSEMILNNKRVESFLDSINKATTS